jgi:hypothetical protein
MGDYSSILSTSGTNLQFDTHVNVHVQSKYQLNCVTDNELALSMCKCQEWASKKRGNTVGYKTLPMFCMIGLTSV